MTVHESSNYPELIRKSQSPEDTHQVLMCETREGAGEGEIGDYPVRLEDDHTLSGSQQCTWPPGCRPYLCLVGCFFLMFNSYGLINAYGSFVSYYKDHLLAGRDALLYNLIGTTQSFLVLFPSAIIGRVLDAGYVKVLTGGGTTLVSLGLFSLSVVNGKGADKDAGAGQGSYGLIWLMQALILGLGMTCFVVTSSYMVATWFVQRKSFAIGIVSCGASIGGLIYPLMLRYLIGLLGFDVGVRCTAVVAAATSIFSFVVIRPNPLHKIRKPVEGWMKLSVWIDKSAIHDPTMAWYMASVCFMFFGFFAVFFNVEEWAGAEGFGIKKAPNLPILPGEFPKDSIRTFWLLSIMNAFSTCGRLGSTYLGDRWGSLNVNLFATSMAAVLVLVMWTLTHTLRSAVAFVVLYGAVSGAVIALPPATIAEILGPEPEAQAKLGQWTGMTYSVSAVFALTGPVIAGHLVSRYGGYLTVQLWAGNCLIVAALCMTMSRVYLGRHKSIVVEEKAPNRLTPEDRY